MSDLIERGGVENTLLDEPTFDTDFSWSDYGTPSTSALDTTHVHTGTYAYHVVTDAANEGITQSLSVTADTSMFIAAQIYGDGVHPVYLAALDNVTGNELFRTRSVTSADWQEVTRRILVPTGITTIDWVVLSPDSGAEFWVDCAVFSVAPDTPYEMSGKINNLLNTVGLALRCSAQDPETTNVNIGSADAPIYVSDGPNLGYTSYPGGSKNLDSGYVTTNDYYNKVLITLDASGTIQVHAGTQAATEGAVVDPLLQQHEFPIAMVALHDTGGVLDNVTDNDIQDMRPATQWNATELLGPPTTLTISSGAVTPVRRYHQVETEGGAGTDDLTTISGGNQGDFIALTAYDAAHTVVIKHNPALIDCGGYDITLDSTTKVAMFLNIDGTVWGVIAVSDSGGSGEEITISINQSTHGFTVGNLIYHNGTSYVKAIATAEDTAATHMVTQVTDANNFIAVQVGYTSTLSGLTGGLLYYLSTTVAGSMTSTRPTDNYAQPVFLAISTTAGYVLMNGPIAARAWDLPAADGSSGQVIITDGAGTGSWGNVSELAEDVGIGGTPGSSYPTLRRCSIDSSTGVVTTGSGDDLMLNSADDVSPDQQFIANKVWSAVYADLADFQPLAEGYHLDPGTCYQSNPELGGMTPCYKSRSPHVMGVATDTFGLAVGVNGSGVDAKEVPIAVAGFVLAHVDRQYPSGTPLTVAADGGLRKMKVWERIIYPHCIVARYCRPEPAVWWGPKDGEVEVKGRHWVKVV